MQKYDVELSERFKKEFRKLDKYTQKIIRAWINKNLVDCDDPRQHGKGLTANRSGQWRYRIGDYRLICQINDNELIILALSVGHRRDVYE
jgi:mRNA interferase RelE/StbE